MRKNKKFPTLIGLIILVLGAAVGVYLVTNTTILRPQASLETSPKDIRVSNITDNSFTVSWTTDAKTFGSIDWGTTANLGQSQADGTELNEIHSVTIKDLSPETIYFYKINSAGANFDNAGIPWSVTTLSPPSQSSTTEVISGTVIDNNGNPASNVLVYINSDGANTLSAITSQSGSFLIPLGQTTFLADNLLQVFAQGGPSGTSSSQIFYKSANPIPQMVLGQTHDFRNLEQTNQEGLPSSSIDVPNELVEPSSRIALSSSSPVPVSLVTLESVVEGQTFNDPNLEFSGRAPAGTTLVITVQSDPVTEQLQVDENGEWNWTPPQGLEAGEHTVTLAWVDEDGIEQQIVRSFEVSAQELSTPEATSAPQNTNSGGLTLTIILSIIGIGLIIIGLFWNIRINKKGN